MKPAVNPDYVITLQGQEYCTYRGVLDCAHALGLDGIRTRILQVPCPENDYVAIVEAEVRLKDGRTFVDVADASPKNVHSRLASALIRMASTRAKGRALRDAVNIGEALAEELPDMAPEQPAAAERRWARPVAPRPAPAGEPAPPEAAEETAPPAHAGAPTEDPAPPEGLPDTPPGTDTARDADPDAAADRPWDAVCSDPECGRSITRGQYHFSVKGFGEPLCPPCQRKRAARGKSA